jgi:hypothetical protein
MQWRSCLRHCATSRKVTGSIPDAVTGIFHWHNPSGRTMALGLTQPLTEMITRNISLGVNAAGVWGWQPYCLHMLIILKSGSLSLLEHSGPVQACNGITLPFSTELNQSKLHFLSCGLDHCRIVVWFMAGTGNFSSPYQSYYPWSPPCILFNRCLELLLWGWICQSGKLATHCHLILILRTHGAIPPFHTYVFMTCWIRHGDVTLFIPYRRTVLALHTVFCVGLQTQYYWGPLRTLCCWLPRRCDARITIWLSDLCLSITNSI